MLTCGVTTPCRVCNQGNPAMHCFSNTAFQHHASGAAGFILLRNGPGEEAQEEEEGLELPVNPDQGTPLVPDEEGVVTVPT